MAYAKVRTDNLTGTVFGGDLVSVKYQPSSKDTAIENGNFVKVGALISGEREVHTGSTPAANTALSDIVLIASPEVDKAVSGNTIGEFKNRAGDILRGYKLVRGYFSVTKEALDAAAAAIEVGDIVELQAGTKGKVVKSLTDNSTKIGTVEAIEGEWIVIKIA